MLCQLELLTRRYCWRTRLVADYKNRLRNFAFLMQRVRAAFGAELLDRKLIGLRLFVFRGRIVARLAGVA